MVAENEIIPIANRVIGAGDRDTGYGGSCQTGVPARRKDRRRTRYDRRQGVRDGVIVALSFKKDRRKSPDRRFLPSNRPAPEKGTKRSGYNIIA